jgi:hypothetical protein
MGDRGEV